MARSLTVMRHSVRLDKGLRVVGKSKEEELRAVWADRGARPHDSPIADMRLPEKHTHRWKALMHLEDSYASNVVVVASPLRRCLQTAAIVATTLGVSSIIVHYGVVEDMKSILMSGNITGPLCLSESEQQEVMQSVNQGLRVESFVGDLPPKKKADGHARFWASFEDIEKRFTGQHVLVVSHGAAVKALVRYVSPWAVPYDVSECGFCVCAGGRLLHCSRVQLVPARVVALVCISLGAWLAVDTWRAVYVLLSLACGISLVFVAILHYKYNAWHTR